MAEEIKDANDESKRDAKDDGKGETDALAAASAGDAADKDEGGDGVSGSPFGFGSFGAKDDDDAKDDGEPKKDAEAKADAKKDADAKADDDAKKNAEAKADDDDAAKADDAEDTAAAKAPEPAAEAEAPAGTNGETDAAAEAARNAPPPTAGTEELEVEPLIKADDLVPGDPNAEAPPPRKAPAGDARSFRRGDDFAFVYRDGAYLITRLGKVGKNGEWSCVEYPDQGAAAHAYAMRCSDLTGEGFRDLR